MLSAVKEGIIIYELFGILEQLGKNEPE
jgi:hypothetical protein